MSVHRASSSYQARETFQHLWHCTAPAPVALHRQHLWHCTFQHLWHCTFQHLWHCTSSTFGTISTSSTTRL